MNWKSIAAVIMALGSIAGACSELGKNYAIEVHVTRVWGVNEPIPPDVAKEF